MKQKKRLEITRFDNENKTDQVCFEKFYNYLPTDELQNSVGVKIATFPYSYDTELSYAVSLPEGVTKFNSLAVFRQHFPNQANDVYRLMLYGDDKKVYINQMMRYSDQLHWLYGLQFENEIKTLAYKKDDSDAIIISDGKQMKIWITNYSPYSVDNTPVITDMCMNEGVLFCCLKEPAFKIWYATDLNPERVGDINSYSGYIALNDSLGNANRVITFDENVYIIRDYGISKISFIQKSFTVSEVYSSNTKIFANTACVCGNVMLFMTKEGLYTFNGARVTKNEINFAKMIDCVDNITASSLASKYYLACKLNFQDNKQILCEENEYVNNALIVLDVDDYSYEIVRGVDIKQMYPLKTEVFEKMLVLFNSANSDKVGEIVENSIYFDENLPKFWLSKQIFASFETKIFTKLVVNAEKDVKVKLIYDDKEITFTTYQSGINEFIFKIFGKQLKLEISSNNLDANVKNVYLDYYDCWCGRFKKV